MLPLMLYCCLLRLMVVHGEVSGVNPPCSDGCRPSEDNITHCNRTTGECLNGCQKDRWDVDCSKKCSDKCQNTTCIDSHGACLACYRGKTGKNCSFDCPSGCQDSLCFITNRTCVKGCITGQCGQTCDQNCSDVPHVPGIVIGAASAFVVVLVVVLVLICFVLRRWRRQLSQGQYSGVMAQYASPTHVDLGSRRVEIINVT